MCWLDSLDDPQVMGAPVSLMDEFLRVRCDRRVVAAHRRSE